MGESYDWGVDSLGFIGSICVQWMLRPTAEFLSARRSSKESGSHIIMCTMMRGLFATTGFLDRICCVVSWDQHFVAARNLVSWQNITDVKQKSNARHPVHPYTLSRYAHMFVSFCSAWGWSQLFVESNQWAHPHFTHLSLLRNQQTWVNTLAISKPRPIQLREQFQECGIMMGNCDGDKLPGIEASTHVNIHLPWSSA